MQRSTRFNRPGLKGSSKDALLFSSGEQFILKVAPDTTTSIALTWTESFPKPDDYRVERSLDGSSFTTVTTVGNTVFDYTDTGRTESVQYWYRIVPILGGVDQTPSNIADTWTVPATPTGLTATAISSTQINLAWTDVSTGNTAQSIQRRSPAGSGSYSFIASVGATANSYSDTGLIAATQYEYQVAATNPATQSAWSTAANATTTGGGPPSASWTLDFSSGTPSGYTLTRASSGTYVDSSGYIASASTNVARLTHNSSGSRLGLLVEGQRTNQAVQSNTLPTSNYNYTNTTRSANATAAPNNVTEATRVVEQAGTAPHIVSTAAGTTAADICVSIFAKADQRSHIGVRQWVATNNWIQATFDLSAGTAGAVQAGSSSGFSSTQSGIDNYGNGWYRCWVRGTKTSALTYLGFDLCTTASPTLNANGEESYAGNTANGLFLWGAQIETNNTAPSSYIPTTTASVTRSADIAYVDKTNVTNWGRPGSFVVEYYKPLEQSGGVVVADDDGAGNAGRLGLEYSAGGPRIVYGTSGAGSGGTDSAGLNKVGWAWNGSGAATRSALNGSALDTSLATSFDPTLTDGINLGGNIDWTALPLTVSGQPNVVIRRVRFWNSQLSAADLNTLTGPTSFTVDALVVAGGGGGGGAADYSCGGGGGGGYRTASGFSLTIGTTYTITVGAGGAAGSGTAATAGNNSVFSTITSTGGGQGGSYIGGSPFTVYSPGTGGSGGGGGGQIASRTTNGASGTSGQGNGGGNGNSNDVTADQQSGGGGGGAGGTGSNGSTTNGGAGGAASSSSISGSSVSYSGGGGGGKRTTTGGSGGTGGTNAGNGGTASAGGNGTANRGGGGGGGGSAAGGNGGSGVVIIRMATANYSGVHTPATVTTSGSDTILTFTSSGNYVA